MDVTRQPSLKVTSFRALRSCAATSSSAKGTISGSISMTVTCVPSMEYSEANSTPMTPPPITARRSGISGNERAPVESMTNGLSLAPGMGGITGTDPVARITWVAVWVVPSTVTFPGPSKVPWPCTTVTPAFFSVAATPPTRVETTLSFHFCRAGQSIWAPSTFTPNWAP